MIKTILKALIKIYSYAISPLTGRNCRFHPSCSAYAAEAIDTHGAVKGLWLAIKRLSKCHPWNASNPIDPVPPVSYKRCKHKHPETPN